jgi:hypothetical protein
MEAACIVVMVTFIIDNDGERYNQPFPDFQPASLLESSYDEAFCRSI